MHFISCHAPGITKGFFKGEALRLLRTNSSEHRQPKLTMRVTCGTILRNVKMAVNIKDLYGNPGYRFKKISNIEPHVTLIVSLGCLCLEKLYEDNIKKFKTRLRERGYPDNLINNVLREIRFKERKPALHEKQKMRKDILPFVTQYNPAVPNLKVPLRRKCFSFPLFFNANVCNRFRQMQIAIN